MQFFLIGLILFTGLTGVAAADEPPGLTLKSPPVSLAQWYKPANKRQVWLHTMFRLRRSLQALEQHVQAGDRAGMNKWSRRLAEDYGKLGQMVPEWADLLDEALITRLLSAVDEADKPVAIRKLLKKIDKSCRSCHRQYRPLVAAMYRAPDYEGVRVPLPDASNGSVGEQSFHDAMEELSRTLNRILIGLDDGHNELAIQQGGLLAGRLEALGGSCVACHKDAAPRERILGRETRQRLQSLQLSIASGEVKASRKLLGEIGVTVCARCHGTHRTLTDLLEALQAGHKPR